MKNMLTCGSLEISVCSLSYYLFTVWPWAGHVTSLVQTFFEILGDATTIITTTTTSSAVNYISSDIYWGHDKHCEKCLHICLISFLKKPLI